MSDDKEKEGAPSRQPKNLQGLLRFMIEQTANEDHTGPSQLQPMDEERRAWLDEVMQSVSVNVVGIMKKAIDVLLIQDSSEEVGQRKENALDEIIEWVDNIDFSNDFHKIGGLEILKTQLQSERCGVRSRTAQVIADLVQNNPEGQKAANKYDLLSDLLTMLDKDEGDGVKECCMAAISALLRDNSTAQKEFHEHDGFSVMLRAIQTDRAKLIVKGTFLLRALCDENPEYKDTLLNMGFVEQLAAMLQSEHNWTHEYILGALYSLLKGHDKAVSECRRTELNLRQLLTDRANLIQGDEQFEEEYEYSQQILKLAFKDDAENIQEDR